MDDQKHYYYMKSTGPGLLKDGLSSNVKMKVYTYKPLETTALVDACIKLKQLVKKDP